MSTDSSTTLSTAPVVSSGDVQTVTHTPDGALVLHTPYSPGPREFPSLPVLTHEQRLAVQHLVHLRVMEEGERDQFNRARASLAEAVRLSLPEDVIADRRDWLAALERRLAAYKEAAEALEVLLGGES